MLSASVIRQTVSPLFPGEDVQAVLAVIDGGVMMSMVVAVIDRAWLDFPTIKMSLLSVVTRIGFCVGCYAVLWLRIQLYAEFIKEKRKKEKKKRRSEKKRKEKWKKEKKEKGK